MRDEHNHGLQADPLFVGLTRPPMLFGVTYSAMILNLVATVEVFILTRNLLWLLAFVPIHAVLWVVCLYEPRFFDLLQLWLRTRGLAWCRGSVRHWRASSYSPLALDLPDAQGRRRAPPVVIV